MCPHGLKGRKCREADHADRARGVLGQPADQAGIYLVGTRHRLNTDQDQVDLGALCALQDEIRPGTFFIELRPAANAAIGAPLPLPLEKLALLPKPCLEPVTPLLAVGAQRRRGLGEPAPTATVGGNQDHLAVRGGQVSQQKLQQRAEVRSVTARIVEAVLFIET